MNLVTFQNLMFHSADEYWRSGRVSLWSADYYFAAYTITCL